MKNLPAWLRFFGSNYFDPPIHPQRPMRSHSHTLSIFDCEGRSHLSFFWACESVPVWSCFWSFCFSSCKACWPHRFPWWPSGRFQPWPLSRTALLWAWTDWAFYFVLLNESQSTSASLGDVLVAVGLLLELLFAGLHYLVDNIYVYLSELSSQVTVYYGVEATEDLTQFRIEMVFNAIVGFTWNFIGDQCPLVSNIIVVLDKHEFLFDRPIHLLRLGVDVVLVSG